jgi:single-stranded DNA-specific DHH superfamily exonuclease
MIPAKELKKLKEELDSCKNPLFIHDADCDGLCSYLLLYKYKKEGHGVFVKGKPYVGENFLAAVKKYEPDKIFVLDMTNISPEFVEGAKVPIIQIDHHLTEERIHGVKTYNPRFFDKADSSPTTTISYNVVKQNLWIAAIGTVGDWHLTKETKAFAKKYPKLLDPKITNPGEAWVESKVGQLVRAFNFIMKGKTSEVIRTVEELVKINDPKEILEQTTKEGTYVFKRYLEMYQKYKDVYDSAVKQMGKGKLFVFEQPADDISFSAELSNELTYRYPKKVIIITRERDGEMKCSLRSGSIEIRSKLLKALEGVEGYGGGHDKACGAGIKKKDFEKFVEQFKALL